MKRTGGEGYTYEQGPRPTRPECVVCWDIWIGMSNFQRLALWSLYGL